MFSIRIFILGKPTAVYISRAATKKREFVYDVGFEPRKWSTRFFALRVKKMLDKCTMNPDNFKVVKSPTKKGGSYVHYDR